MGPSSPGRWRVGGTSGTWRAPRTTADACRSGWWRCRRGRAWPAPSGEIGGLDERRRVLDGEGARQPARGAGRFEMLGGIALDLPCREQEAVEPAYRRQVTGRAARAQPALPQGGEILAEVAQPRRAHGPASSLEKCREAREVSPVGGERVG